MCQEPSSRSTNTRVILGCSLISIALGRSKRARLYRRDTQTCGVSGQKLYCCLAGRTHWSFRANSSLLCRARFIQSKTIPCSQEQGRVQANCSLLYRGRFIQRKRERQGPTRKRARKSQSAHRQAEQGRENLVHPNFRARKSLEETRFRARKSIVPRAL